MFKIKIESTNSIGGVYVTEESAFISENEVIKSFEYSIVNFIESIDSEFFRLKN